MLDQKRQSQEKQIVFLFDLQEVVICYYAVVGEHENITAGIYISYKKAFLALNRFKFKEAL